jgi:U3 small nucleolar RNA-associated protein 14
MNKGKKRNVVINWHNYVANRQATGQQISFPYEKHEERKEVILLPVENE